MAHNNLPGKMNKVIKSCETRIVIMSLFHLPANFPPYHPPLSPRCQIPPDLIAIPQARNVILARLSLVNCEEPEEHD